MEGDKFLGIEGTVEVQNIESGQTVILGESSIVLSSSDGNLSTQNMTSQDFEQIDQLDNESGEYEEFDVDTGFDDTNDTDDTSVSNDTNIIRIEFENQSGELKEIIIKYK